MGFLGLGIHDGGGGPHPLGALCERRCPERAGRGVGEGEPALDLRGVVRLEGPLGLTGGGVDRRDGHAAPCS
jgi:hypothetical protein